MSGPSDYEQKARQQILTWKRGSNRWISKALAKAGKPLDLAGEAILKTPGVGPAIQKSVDGILRISNDAAQWSIRPELIYRKFRERGYEHVHESSDVQVLDLEVVDRTIGRLGARYRAVAAAEGATTGAVGLPGIPIDIVALVTLNLRAIGEYATYCGLDVGLAHERLFAMTVLGYASSPDDAAKTAAMSQLVKIARDVARKKTWKDLEGHLLVKLIQQIAKALGLRLTKAKLAQVLPAVGAVIGGGFNAHFTAKVCDAAYFHYRERFLAGKYGSDWVSDPTRDA